MGPQRWPSPQQRCEQCSTTHENSRMSQEGPREEGGKGALRSHVLRTVPAVVSLCVSQLACAVSAPPGVAPGQPVWLVRAAHRGAAQAPPPRALRDRGQPRRRQGSHRGTPRGPGKALGISSSQSGEISSLNCCCGLALKEEHPVSFWMS